MSAPVSIRRPRRASFALRGLARCVGVALGLVAALTLACSTGGSSSKPGSGGGGGGGGNPGSQTQPDMRVTPKATFQATGVQGGPFAPTSVEYTVENVGGTALTWTVESTEPWATVSTTGGQLDAGASVKVIASLDQSQAALLLTGVHTGSLDFVNETNQRGTTSRGLVIDVLKPSGLTVEPEVGFASIGPRFGPFFPAAFDYEVSNTGSNTLTWSALLSRGGLTLSTSGGMLAPGASTTLTVTIDQAAAATLPLGSHSAILFILDHTNGNGSTTRPMSVDVTAPTSGGTMASSLTQFGIEWTFDKPYEVGQFANGDWWVVGPVQIVEFDPPSARINGRTTNGSMINPTSFDGMAQGYDSTMYAQYKSPGDYSALLNVALDVSPTNPLVVKPNSSVVSTVSQSLANTRPQIQTAAVLTVLPQPAPEGSFRPPYSSENKKIRFNESDLDYDLLGKLPRLPSTPSVASAEQSLRRPWIDHVPLWIGRYIHPQSNMPDYGRDMADTIGNASLMLNLNYTDEQKRDLLVSFVQLGIDFYGVAQHGGANNWAAAAGHMSGRKWPILFAGILLGDPAMSGIGFDTTIQFGEDGQTFYVEETSPGVFNNGNGGYTAAEVGLADWGTAHSHRPSLDDATWHGDPYRLCCTANSWWGQVLSARIMGAQALWNHDELFDYQDRYFAENVARGILDYRLTWSRFPMDMWNAYRAAF